MQRNWKNIFRLQKFSFVIVNIDNVQERLVFFIKNKQELQKESSFFVLFPEAYEINQFSSGDYLRKYAPQLKSFMESDTSTVLIADEIILNTIIRPDKKLNFLRFMSKKQKKLILFCATQSTEDFLEFKKNFLIINKEKLEQELKVFENFLIIKEKIAQTHNPFKNAKNAFELIKKNNN